MRVLLAYRSHRGGADDPYAALLPIGLGYIHALLREEGHSSLLANLSRSTSREIATLLHEHRPQVVAISQFTHNRGESLRLAALVKKEHPASLVVFGGPHATFAWEELLAAGTPVDAVVLGEGEATFAELLGVLERTGRDGLRTVAGLAVRAGGKPLLTGERPPVADLDSLPVPARFFDETVGVDRQRQLEYVTTSRGCPAACHFCSSPLFWGKGIRFRTPRAIVDELRFLRDRFGLIYFSLRDDTFTADKGRVIEFCRLLLEEGLYILWNCQSRVNCVDGEILAWLKRAGCECVQFGVESGSPRMLRELGKAITPLQVEQAALAARRVGLNLSVYLITGIPGETDEELRETLRLIERIRPHDGQVAPLAYYPGTALFARSVAAGKAPADLFAPPLPEARFVRLDRFAEQSSAKLLRKLEDVGGEAAYRAADFREQQRLLGFCHATNVLAGGGYEARGEWGRAEAQYREIVARQPANPWGWLLLGELAARRGRLAEAREAFLRLLELVPKHAPAYGALGELARLAGDRRQADSYFRQALALDPFEATARACMGSGRKKKGETR